MSIRIVPETLLAAKEIPTIIIGTKEVLVPWEQRINQILNKNTGKKLRFLSIYIIPSFSTYHGYLANVLS